MFAANLENFDEKDDGVKEEQEIHRLCSKMEEQGFSLRQCSEADEALEITNGLIVNNRLRCLVIGSGHGITQIVTDKIVDSLNSLDSFSNDRLLIYAGAEPLSEKHRLKLWVSGITVCDSLEELQEAMENITKNENGEEDHSDEDEDEDDEVETKGQNGTFHLLDINEEVKQSHDAAKSLLPAGIKRLKSWGTNRLEKLRANLAELTKKFDSLKISLDIQKANFVETVMSSANKLEQCLNKRRNTLINELPSSVKTLLLNYENEADRITELAEAGPEWGVKAALALAYFHGNSMEEGKEAAYHLKCIRTELLSLERTALSAELMSRVMPEHQKLLNLAHDWLHTFLPHCLKKINRVSFGLLTEKECRQALIDDPRLPPSRLKLAVPFIGKDVPSQSSEFAHPDVILGLTVLAYRYSGIRRQDFNDIIDHMTSSFTREIGPVHDRPSAKLYEKWVKSAGGSIRGGKKQNDIAVVGENAVTVGIDKIADTSENEVIQLKYLQKSNQDQMTKLHMLWLTEPLCIHYYLRKLYFLHI